MSLISAIKHKLGLSVTPANNFVLDASANNGTMKLARESGQDIMTVDAAGKVAFPQMPLVINTPIVATSASTEGWYVKFADGTYLESRTYSCGGVAAGAIFNSPTLTYSVGTLNGPPNISVAPSCSFPFLVSVGLESGTSGTEYKFSLQNGHTSSLVIFVQIIILGRWR